MGKFAQTTTVEEGRTRAEIESTLKRYGAAISARIIRLGVAEE